MEACSVETGLLKKKPCGHPAVAKCLNCEQPLCTQHAVPQLTEGGKRSGKFMCQECAKAHKAHEKAVASAPKVHAEKPKAPGTPAPAPGASAAAPAKDGAAPKPAESDALEFTPSKPAGEK